MSNLQEQFLLETDISAVNSQGEPDIDYVKWLENKVEETAQQTKLFDGEISLNNFITASLLLIKLLLIKDVDGLISRIFYALEHQFYDWKFPMLYSENAIKIAKNKNLPLTEMRLWKDKRYIKSGKNKVLHREHVFTGKMFKKSLVKLDESNQLTVKNVVDLIKNNYCVAYIDKQKDHDKVNKGKGKDGIGNAKSDRGLNLNEALNFFKEKGVILHDTFVDVE